MPLLVIGMLRATWALRHDRQFVSLALLALVAIVSGTGFYSIVEGFASSTRSTSASSR
jgi:hypothetical protein